MPRDNARFEGNIHRRFVIRVLIPPFIALFILCLIGLWQLDGLLRNQAINDLRRSSEATAASLEREFGMRETVLKRTGTELFVIKSEYQDGRKKLETDRSACQEFVRTRRAYQNSPNGVCEPFLNGFATRGASLVALEDEYVRVGQEMIKDQNQRINERLSSYKQFFPETLGLVVMDEKQQIVSTALSGAFKGSAEAFQPDAVAALKSPVYGRQMTLEGYTLGVFAFPIQGGSVLAAYDLYNSQFLRQAWDRAPIDRKQSLAVILDAQDNVAYPNIKNAAVFKSSGAKLRHTRSTEVTLDGVAHTAAAARAGPSGWAVVVASPTAAVLAPLRDAQLASVIVIGLFLVGFTWVGSYFIQRTLQNIVRLVSGAIIFGSGRLDYKIELDHADSEFMRLGETMNVMAARIAAAEKAVDEKNKEFISITTHEIRAPLTAIIGHLSLFQDMYGDNLSKMDKQAEGLFNQAYYGATRLRDMINDMLNVARLESGRSEFSLVPVDIKQVVQSVMSNMEAVGKIAKVTLDYRDTNAALVMTDEGQLRIIMNNFISNAIKYNRPDGTVTVSHQLQDGQLLTVIADTGLGIPDNQKAHMFEKYFRVDDADRKAVTGTGLGMYVVKRYVEQMGGKLWFDSVHGKGTTFYFTLPLAKVTLAHKFKSGAAKLAKRASPVPRVTKAKKSK